MTRITITTTDAKKKGWRVEVVGTKIHTKAAMCFCQCHTCMCYSQPTLKLCHT